MISLTDEEYKDIIIRAYEYMYSVLNSYDDYIYTARLLDGKTIDNFINHIRLEDHTNNVEFILNFIESSFGYYAKNTTKYRHGLRTISLSWIIGKPAIQRTEQLKTDYPNFPNFLKFMRTRVGASLFAKFESEIGTKVSKMSNQAYIKLSKVEEDFKALCENDDVLLEHCLTGTFLYNHNSTRCVFCYHMKECKNLLQQNYPKIYKLRGY